MKKAIVTIVVLEIVFMFVYIYLFSVGMRFNIDFLTDISVLYLFGVLFSLPILFMVIFYEIKQKKFPLRSISYIFILSILFIPGIFYRVEVDTIKLNNYVIYTESKDFNRHKNVVIFVKDSFVFSKLVGELKVDDDEFIVYNIEYDSLIVEVYSDVSSNTINEIYYYNLNIE